jgi:predicted nucleic acid-binding protein
MTFANLPAGSLLFIDANTFIYHFTPEPVLGPACRSLLERIARQEVTGMTSAHVPTNVAHRLMTIEAMARYGWPEAGIASRLKKHHVEIRNLDRHRQAIDGIAAFGIQVLAITQPLVASAAVLSQQHEILSGDALIVAVMQANGLTNLASNDADFDRVPGITRCAPA